MLATLVAVFVLGPGSALGHTGPPSGGGVCDAVVDPYVQTVSGDAPLAYWPLDESSGTVVCDYSGNNSGTYAASGVTYGVAGPLAGDPSQTAVSASGAIPGANPVGTVAALPAMSGDHSFTLEGWFQGDSSSPNEVLVALNGGSTDGLAIWKGHCDSGSDVYIALDEHGADNCWDAQSIAGINLLDGNWHYLAITYDAASGQVDAYVDGVDLGSQPLNPSATIAFSNPAVLLGGWTDTTVNQPFSGAMAQVAVYGTALSAGEIGDHYDDAAAVPTITAPSQAIDEDVAAIQTTTHNGYSWTVGGAESNGLSFNPETTSPQPVAVFAANATSTIADPEDLIAGRLSLRLDDSTDELTGASVTVQDPYGQDMLAVTDPVAGISASYSQTSGTTGTLTLSGLAEVSDYQTVLDSVVYYYAWSTSNPGVYVDRFGGDQTRPVTWQVSDGTTVSAIATTQLQILMPNLITTDTDVITGGTAPCDTAPETLIAGSDECQPSGLTVGGTDIQVAYNDQQSLGTIFDKGPINFSVDKATTNNACTAGPPQPDFDFSSLITAVAPGTCVIDISEPSETGSAPGSGSTIFAASLDQISFPVTSGPQSVAFTSSNPGKANAGSTYTVAAASSSGSAVSFEIDATSTAGSCTLGGPAADIVSFNGPGNCVIDANAAATANQLSAQAKQSVTVVGLSVRGLGVIKSTGTSVGFSLPCTGSATASCTGTVSLVAGEQVKGSKPVGVVASSAEATHRRRTVIVTLGSEQYSIAGGQHKTITIKLNALARRLLKTFHKLPTQLDVKPTGAPHTTVLRTLTIKPVKRKARDLTAR